MSPAEGFLSSMSVDDADLGATDALISTAGCSDDGPSADPEPVLSTFKPSPLNLRAGSRPSAPRLMLRLPPNGRSGASSSSRFARF
jgi:hypothetical protein